VYVCYFFGAGRGVGRVGKMDRENRAVGTFVGGVQQSAGSDRESLIRLACFSFDTMVRPNRAPTPTNSASSSPSTQVCTFTLSN
jgi:hypothetical protein